MKKVVEITEDTNKWKGFPFYVFEDNIVKISILPKAVYRCNAITIKISMAFFFQKNDSQIHMDY